jgi:hypothetical protein
MPATVGQVFSDAARTRQGNGLRRTGPEREHQSPRVNNGARAQ